MSVVYNSQNDSTQSASGFVGPSGMLNSVTSNREKQKQNASTQKIDKQINTIAFEQQFVKSEEVKQLGFLNKKICQKVYEGFKSPSKSSDFTPALRALGGTVLADLKTSQGEPVSAVHMKASDFRKQMIEQGGQRLLLGDSKGNSIQGIVFDKETSIWGALKKISEIQKNPDSTKGGFWSNLFQRCSGDNASSNTSNSTGGIIHSLLVVKEIVIKEGNTSKRKFVVFPKEEWENNKNKSSFFEDDYQTVLHKRCSYTTSPLENGQTNNATVIVGSGAQGKHNGQHSALEALAQLLNGNDVILWDNKQSENAESTEKTFLAFERLHNYCTETLKKSHEEIIVKGLCKTGPAALAIASKYAGTNLILDQTFTDIENVGSWWQRQALKIGNLVGIGLSKFGLNDKIYEGDIAKLKGRVCVIRRDTSMTRISKQAERRHRSPRKSKVFAEKTGTLKDNLPKGYKEHANAVGNAAVYAFIPKIKSL